jgi:hypothetical protein
VTGGFYFGAAQLESACSERLPFDSPGHGLSDRDGSHVRVDGRVDSARAVCGRARSFGFGDRSTVY